MSSRISILGDPHLGRTFIHGVPLNRRGERESYMWSDFSKHLFNVKDVDYHICLGDLFDKAVVPYDVINQAAVTYLTAANENPKVEYIIMKGNHDWMRDLDRVSAFDIFWKIVAPQKNITVVDTSHQVGEEFACFAWQPFMPTSELVKTHGQKYKQAFGHWDIDDFGGSNPNLIPLKDLQEHGATLVTTGHVHKPCSYKDPETGLDVVVYGSMQPYAHGEEIDTSLYLTITKDQIDTIDLSDKCVRVVLNPGESLDDEIDCLQLTIKRLSDEVTEDETVSLGDFDIMGLFQRAFKDAGVSEETTEAMVQLYQQKRMSDGI